MRFGILAAALFNTAGKHYTKKDGSDFQPGDFFPSLRGPEPDPSELEEQQKMAFMKMFGWKPKEEANG